jgi:hypothetical protein
VKAGSKPSNWLAKNFGLYKTQDRYWRVDLSSHCSPWDEMKPLGAHTTTKQPIETRTGVLMALQRSSFTGAEKSGEKV